MSQARGYHSIMEVVPEVSYATDPGSGYVEVPIVSHTLKQEQTLEETGALTGNRSEAPPLPGPQLVSGDIVVPLDGVHLANWLDLVFDVDGTLLNDQVSATIVDRAKGVSLFKYSGCKIARLGINISRREPLRMTLGVVGSAMAAAASADPTGVAVRPFHIGHMAIAEGGSPILSIVRLQIDVDFGISAEDMILAGGGANRKEATEGSIAVTGTLTALLDSTAILTKQLAETESSLTVTLDNGAHSLTISLPELLYGGPTMDVPGPQGRLQQIPFRAFVDDDEGASAIQMLLAEASSGSA